MVKDGFGMLLKNNNKRLEGAIINNMQWLINPIYMLGFTS